MKYIIALASLLASTVVSATATHVVVPAPPHFLKPGVQTVKPVVQNVKPVIQNSVCPNTAYAVLFEQSNFAGIKHWLDGNTGGDCRGLNGTNIRSIQYVRSEGGDPVTEKINSNVKLTFFNDFGCAGSVMGATQGNQASLSGIDGAKSVKITCGNEGSGATSASYGPSGTVVLVATVPPSKTSYGAVESVVPVPAAHAQEVAAAPVAASAEVVEVAEDSKPTIEASAIRVKKSGAASVTVSAAGGITALAMSLLL